MQVPKLRFKEFTNEWNLNKLKDFSNRVTRKNKDNLSKLPLTISAQDGLVDQISFFNKTVASKDLSGYYLLYNGDFAYNKSYSNGYPWGTIKRLDKYDMGVLSTLYICFKPNSTINSNFLVQLFNSTVWYSGISEIAVEGARNHGLLNISVSDFFETIYKIPSLEEQTKIANFLSLIDRKIELQEKLVENLKLYKKGLLQKVFSNNHGWNIIKFSSIIKKGKAGGTPTSNNKQYYNGNIPFLSITDITSQGKYIYTTEKNISELGLNSSSTWIVPQNSLIYSMYASVGIPTINKIPLATSQAMFNIILNENENLEYIYYYLLYFHDNGLSKLIETGTQGNINAQYVLNLNILYPSIEEQTQIANLFSNLDKKIDFETNRLTNLKEYKKGLLQQMFI